MNINILTKLLEATYEVGCLSKAEQAEYYLISRYESKVSVRLKERKAALCALAKLKMRELMGALIHAKNPLLVIVDNDQLGNR